MASAVVALLPASVRLVPGRGSREAEPRDARVREVADGSLDIFRRAPDEWIFRLSPSLGDHLQAFGVTRFVASALRLRE